MQLFPALAAGLAGALIGAIADALTPGKVTIYERARGSSRGPALGLSPILSPRRQGLAVSIAF